MSQSRITDEISTNTKRRNVGAYSQPFSGVGMEFEPLGTPTIDTGFTLHETGYLAKACPWNFPNVYSPFWRIYFDYETVHHVRFGDKLTQLGPDRVLVIPNHQRFDCVGELAAEKLWFAFSCTHNADPSQEMPIIIPVNKSIMALTEEFPPLFRCNKTNKQERIFNLSLAFVLYVTSRPEIKWQQPLPDHVSEAVALINKTPDFPWTTTILAERVAMSSDGFSRAFQRWLHTTPVRYVQQIRIREACQMLSESDESIDYIARHVGFTDRFHFSRVFKRHTNTTPAIYRKLHGLSSS